MVLLRFNFIQLQVILETWGPDALSTMLLQFTGKNLYIDKNHSWASYGILSVQFQNQTHINERSCTKRDPTLIKRPNMG